MSHNPRQREITVSPNKTVDGRTVFRQRRIAPESRAQSTHTVNTVRNVLFFPLFTNRVGEPPAAVAP